MKKIYMIALISISLFSTLLFGESIGADVAAPKIEEVIKTVDVPQGKVYVCSDQDVELLIATAADVQINIFELIDCVYRYLEKNKLRIKINGSSLRKLMDKYEYGDERILSLMPVPLINKIYLGYKLKKNDRPFEVYMKDKYEKYVEIATVLYEKDFGFTEMKPNLFLNSYGMKVKKFNIKLRVKKIHLYEPGYGAVYAKGFFKPKKWGFETIKKKEASTKKDAEKEKAGDDKK